MSEISFGTDGWRAIVGQDFNQNNVILVAKAIGKYVYEKYGINKSILVGYDPNMADTYSLLTAELLARYGFKVFYSLRVVPTPVLAYCAKKRNACAIMFTASHNPPEYLGIKFIPDYAGPATSDITDKLMENIGQELPNDFFKKELNYIDFAEEYYEQIEKIIDFEKIKSLKENIIFDGLYAASIGYFDELLKRHEIKFDSIHMEHDSNFGGGMPDPKPKYLKELMQKVKRAGNSVGCANDGDSDRFGFVNENGEFVTPNEIISILLMHLVKNKEYKGCLVKTVGASLLLDRVAQKLNVPIVETAVGFKHVGEAMRKNDCIIGGEESGGLSIKGHIPEKDGILANLLILEAMACFDKSMIELQKEIHDFAGAEFFNDRIDLKLNNRSEIDDIMKKFKDLKSICGLKIYKIDLKDGVKIYFGENNWVLVRPSGTEPLLRIYFETDNKDNLEKFKNEINSHLS